MRKMQNQSNNPMQPAQLVKAPRCLAKTRKGTECQSPAVRGRKRCRMHGGNNPGAPKGNRNARKHGAYSTEANFLKTTMDGLIASLKDV
ncbi:HGGxSTG domain-containing protein [Sphingopyxis sp. BSNA05]|uniref:HGGxSTG domain-containing protein n=1 Tax=Sphingopyxis sp. BSNA05 TaxID=1236614 RepID=UPI00349FC3CD